MEKINEITQGVKSGWGNIDRKKKGTLIFALVAMTLFIAFYSWYNGRVTYAALFTNLDLKDAGTITADLDTKANIAYRIENGGRDIFIDEKHVDKYRLDLAMNGMMPQNSTGFEIFDDMGMMVTDEDRKIMYQRALEGELQRSVMSLTEISAARVHLVMSRDSIFDTERREASASVVVEIRKGAKLTEEAVRGIVALVSGAVDNLPENKVKVIDTSGNVLNLGMASGTVASGLELLGKQSEIRSGFESTLSSNIWSLLGPAFGPDKIKVSVFADLDFDAEEKTVISYKDPVIRSEQKSATGTGLKAGDIMEDPIGENVQNVLDGKGKDGLASFDGTVNYELTESRTNTVRAPGKVRKISTSVLYDGTLTEGQMASIQNLVATATGFDQARGDSISVEGIVFDKSYQEALDRELEALLKEREASRTFMDRYGEYVFFGVFGVLALLLLVSVMRVLLGGKRRDPEFQFATETAVPVGKTLDIIEEVYQKFEVRDNPQERQVKEYAQEHPELAADLIKAWMKG
jgi:flagellar M-ring protein FliF